MCFCNVKHCNLKAKIYKTLGTFDSTFHPSLIAGPQTTDCLNLRMYSVILFWLSPIKSRPQDDTVSCLFAPEFLKFYIFMVQTYLYICLSLLLADWSKCLEVGCYKYMLAYCQFTAKVYGAAFILVLIKVKCM